MTAAPPIVRGSPGAVRPVTTAVRLRGVLACTRPRQWLKNVLVAAVPFAAGALGQPAVVARTVAAIAAFTLVSAATYLLNDVRDATRDAAHPVKRTRPVAAGLVPPRWAVATAAIALAAGLGLAATVSLPLLTLVAVYIATTTAYSCGLKHLAWVEMALVAAGFVLRALAGSAATGLRVSPYFLATIASGAALLVVGKRMTELRLLTRTAKAHRPALAWYRPVVLAWLGAASALALAVAYAAWAAGRGDGAGHVLAALSLLPVLAGLGRYAAVLAVGGGGAPEEILLGDRSMRWIILSWLVLFGVGLVAS